MRQPTTRVPLRSTVTLSSRMPMASAAVDRSSRGHALAAVARTGAVSMGVGSAGGVVIVSVEVTGGAGSLDVHAVIVPTATNARTRRITSPR